MSTRMRKAKVGSCSMVRSLPSATEARSSRSSIATAPPCSRNSGSPTARKSPTCGTNSMTPSARCGQPRPARRGRPPGRRPTCLRAPTIRSGSGSPTECSAGPRCRVGRIRVDALDHADADLADALHDADRTQQAGGVVDQIEKGHHRQNAEQCGDEDVELVHRLVQVRVSTRTANTSVKTKHADDAPDGVVAQQRRRDDARRVLARRRPGSPPAASRR